MRIVLHGFGSFPVVFWHLIHHARTCNNPAEWAILLTSDHYEARFRELLGPDHVSVLTQAGAVPMPGEEAWVYPGAFYRDLAAEKRNYLSGPGDGQRERGIEIYRQTRRFMEAFRPTHALVSQVEGFDGKAFIAAARDFGAKVVVPTATRNLGREFFSGNDFETLPAYAFRGSDRCMDEAEAFVRDFRTSPKSARNVPPAHGELLYSLIPPLSTRLPQALRRWFLTPNGFQWDFLRASVLNNLPGVRDRVWAMRVKKNERLCHISSPEKLPAKFIFYPLQYTPESSINTPAPYFLDQMRAIDAIRFAMPSDCMLVVKEHPSCILLRPSGLLRQLLKTAGVVVAHFRMPANEIAKRAGLTISVTGTATFEAMLQGKQAICLGPNFFSSFLGGICPLDELPARIAKLFGQEYPFGDAVRAVATILNASYPLHFTCPGTPGEPVLRRENIAAFYEAFLDHCRRDEAEDGRTP